MGKPLQFASVDRKELDELWAAFPIWTEEVTQVVLVAPNVELRGLTGVVVERRDPEVIDGRIISYGEYKVRWHDPKYGISGWLRPQVHLVTYLAQ